MISDNKNNNFKAVLAIEAMAQMLGVHQRTLRIYDKEGILKPVRNNKNRRKYSLNDVNKGEFILFLTRNLAINLAGVKIILSLLEKNNIEPKDYISFINDLAIASNINKDVQKKYRQNFKKGRPKEL